MNTYKRLSLVLAAAVVVLVVPSTAIAQEDSTSTTAEIEISATSITSTTQAPEDTQGGSGGVSSGTDDTLPFTGVGSRNLASVALGALLAGATLVALAHRRSEDAKTD